MGTPISRIRQGDKLKHHEVRVKMLLFHCYTHCAHLSQINSVFIFVFVPFFRIYVLWLYNLYIENIHPADCRGSVYT